MGLVLGVDPGLGHCGWVLAQLEPGPTAITIRDLGVIKTKRSDRKRGVRESDDLLRRVRSFYQQLGDVLRHNEVFAICAESMSWPRNAASTAKIALCWGALAALASERGLPFVQASPQEVKRATSNPAHASPHEAAAGGSSARRRSGASRSDPAREAPKEATRRSIAPALRLLLRLLRSRLTTPVGFHRRHELRARIARLFDRPLLGQNQYSLRFRTRRLRQLIDSRMELLKLSIKRHHLRLVEVDDRDNRVARLAMIHDPPLPIGQGVDPREKKSASERARHEPPVHPDLRR